jgi:uncharacterized membrane protein
MSDSQILDPIPEPYKLYSSMSIRIATFIGSPIAAGFLIRRNFIALGDQDKGRNALIVAIAATILMFVGIYMIPEQIMDRIPNLVIPIIYMLVVHYYVDITQGAALKLHTDRGGEFYSGWRAAGIGFLALGAVIPLIFAYAFYGPQDFDFEAYNVGIEEFNKNEEEALTVYELESDLDILEFIDEKGISLWEENVVILNELDKIDGLYPEYTQQNEVLRKYSELRIEALEMEKKVILEPSSKNDRKLESVYEEINATIAKL